MNVDIITSEMHQIHGANRVTEKLIFGQNIFAEHDLNLRYLISQDGIMKCKEYTVSQLGSDMQQKTYGLKRKIIETLKKLPVYSSYCVQKKILEKQIGKNEIVLSQCEKVNSKPDAIIFQDPYTAYVYLKNKGNDIPSILISHAADDPLEHLLMNRPSLKGRKEELRIRNLMEYVFRNVSRVVTICKSSQEYMLDTYGLSCPCIINGIEDISYDLEHNNRLSKKDGVIHIVEVASVQYRKGQDIALKAISKLTDAEKSKIKFHFVGDGKDIAKIRKLATSLNVEESVSIEGACLDIKAKLSEMDVFMLPSRADTVPVAIIEALREGMPVFASDVGEIPFMISKGGILIEATEDSVFRTLKDIIYGEYDLETLGIEARDNYLNEYNLESMIIKYCDVLKRIS